MLSMLLLLAAAPQSVSPRVPEAPPRLMQLPGGPTMRVYGQTPSICGSGVVRTDATTASGSDLMWREGGDAVALYRLLERRIDGCPAPVVVNYRSPGSTAPERDAGRSATPAPLIIRQP